MKLEEFEMPELKAIFKNRSGQPNFREFCTYRLAGSERSPHAGLQACAVDLGSNPESDLFPGAAVIWDKATDRFAVAFPEDNEHILHRLKVHFFHEGYKVVKDSTAFKPVDQVLDRMPGLADKDIAVSGTNRMIENLTHVQLEAILVNAKRLNDTAKAVHDLTSRAESEMRLIADNAFPNRPATAAPDPAPA